MSLPQGTVRWSFESYGTGAVTPSTAHGRVYVGGASLFALDLPTGHVRWERKTDDIADCTPVVVDRTVFVAGGDLLAVDAETGAVRWRRPPAPEGGFHDATHADGMICAGAGPTTLRACDAATGEDLWHVAFDGLPASASRFADGVFYVSRTDGVHALHASTGTRRWTADTGDAVVTAPTVTKGRVFIGMGRSSSGGALGVRALDAESGRTLWHANTDGYVGSAPIVAGGVLYATAAGGTAFTLDPATGREGWRTEVRDAGQGLAVADGVVYVCGTWTVTALDARTGTPLWSSKPEVFGLCAPLVVNGTVVLCDDAGLVYAVVPPKSR
ncbi:PQQ-binding-like beta-propeller repeat protein [Streptomyces carpinensis]|uniref:PQQ-binding-like beta-propeller repeat protein n=1 Tax=Streptomyces carpinensis TaxID=66369 RepID=A0ABV1W902_9ACTN|nr:PQQ-binding-like beta-propeller repeat protein [Streptomyces carpinensis]